MALGKFPTVAKKVVGKGILCPVCSERVVALHIRNRHKQGHPTQWQFCRGASRRHKSCNLTHHQCNDSTFRNRFVHVLYSESFLRCSFKNAGYSFAHSNPSLFICSNTSLKPFHVPKSFTVSLCQTLTNVPPTFLTSRIILFISSKACSGDNCR